MTKESMIMEPTETHPGQTREAWERTTVRVQADNVCLKPQTITVDFQTPAMVAKSPSGYRDLKAIGSGGTSLVYSAICSQSGQIVALKQLRHELTDKPQAVTDFLQEPQILLGLRHPNIIRCIDFFFDCETWWIVLEYLPEGSLKAFMPTDEIRNHTRLKNSMAQIADALGYLHSKGLIHGDVKPGNILLNDQQAVLADFGYCSLLKAKQSFPPRIFGTIEYMSDDALRGIRSFSNDWYALKKTSESLGVERIEFNYVKA